MATLSRTTLFTRLAYTLTPKPISTSSPFLKYTKIYPTLIHTRNCSAGFSLQGNIVSHFKELVKVEQGKRLMGNGVFRVSAVLDGGSGGGFGGLGGGDDGRGDGSGGGGGGNGSNQSLLSWYLNLLEKYPVVTKAVTSAILTLIGDIICQVVIDQAPSLDLKRTLLFTSMGFALVGPTLHFWYLYLSKLVTMSGAKGAFLRLVLDQFLFSPVFIGVFLSTLLTLEGKPSQVVPKLQQEWFSAVVANWQLWIPFQFLNFRFVPQQFQVAVTIFAECIVPTLPVYRLGPWFIISPCIHVWI